MTNGGKPHKPVPKASQSEEQNEDGKARNVGASATPKEVSTNDEKEPSLRDRTEKF